MGNFLDLNLIDTQYNYQHSLSAKSIVIIHDVSKSASQGNLNLRAFRLTDNFMKLYATKKYTTEAFAKAKLSFSTIFEELPLTVHNSYLATALLQELDTPAANQTIPSFASFSKDDESAQVQSILTPNFDILDLELDPFLEKNLDDLLDCSEAQHQEQNNWQYWQRSVGREQAKIQQYLQKKKQENLHRVAQHLEPVPEPTEHELAALFKLPPEPSRLESMVLNAQMHHFCKQLNQFAGPSLGRLFAVQELQK
jgi:translation initiation factor 3 subunit H